MKEEYKELFNAITPDSDLVQKVTGRGLTAHHTVKTIKTLSRTLLAAVIVASLTVVSYAGITAPEFLVSMIGSEQEKVDELFYGADTEFEGGDEFTFVYKGMLADAFNAYIVYDIHSPQSYCFTDSKGIEYFDDMNIDIKPFWFGSGGCSGALKYIDEHTLRGIVLWNGNFPLVGMKAQLNVTKLGIIKKSFDENGTDITDIERETISDAPCTATVKFRCNTAHSDFDTNAVFTFNDCRIETESVRVSPVNITVNAKYTGDVRFTLNDGNTEKDELLLAAKYNDGSVHDCGTLSYSETYNESSHQGKITFSTLQTELLEYSEICELTIYDCEKNILAVINAK